MPISRAALLVLTLMLISTPFHHTLAQSSGATTGAIVGTVKDAQGGVIVGAVISVKQIETNFARTVLVREDGNYTVTQLPPGNYEVNAQAEGFTTQVEKLNVN